MRYWILLSALTLSACGDPLASLDRIRDVDLAETDPIAQAIPTDDEVAREGFFGTDAAEGTVPPDALATAPDPNDASDENLQAALPEPPPRRGILGLFRRVAPQAALVAPTAAPADPSPANADDTAVEGTSLDADLIAEAVADVDASNTVSDNNIENAPEPVEVAALPPETEPRRQGLFGALFAPRSTGTDGNIPAKKSASALREVDYDTVIPYGEVARSCAARGRPLGRKIEQADAKGYRLFDSNPRGEGLRTFYITGFPDGCPRQITAANVLFGSPSFYEQLHYGPAAAHLATGETDAAYEKVKRKVCGTGKGKPCGSKIKQMDRSTFFVTSYPRLGATPRWSEILIHDGEVVASGFKNAG